jgi:O-antigen/teichoic acid export membrane protein
MLTVPGTKAAGGVPSPTGGLTAVTRVFQSWQVTRLNATRKAAVLAMIVAVASQLALAISGIVSARLLGVEGRGHFALLVLIPALLSQLGNLGLPLAATYYIASAGATTRAVCRRLAVPVLCQCAALMATHACIVMGLSGSKPVAFRIAATLTLPVAPLLLLQQYGLAVLQGERRFALLNALRLAPSIAAALALGVVYLAFVPTLEIVTLFWVIGLMVVCGATVLAAAGWARRHDPSAPPPRLGSLTRYGLKAVLGATAPIETFRVDQIVVGLLLTPAALGLYVVALALTNLPRFLAVGLGTVAYPAIAAAREEERRRLTVKFLSLGVVVCCGVAAVLGWFAPQAITFLFGRQYEAATPLAQILLVASALASCRRILADCARGGGRPAADSVAEGIAWLSLASGIYMLVGKGIVGVSLALVLSAATGFAALVLCLAVPYRLQRGFWAPPGAGAS